MNITFTTPIKELQTSFQQLLPLADQPEEENWNNFIKILSSNINNLSSEDLDELEKFLIEVTRINEKYANLIFSHSHKFINTSNFKWRISIIKILREAVARINLSGKEASNLAMALFDSLSLCYEVMPTGDYTSGYETLTILAKRDPENVLPFFYRILSNPSHPMRIKVMKLIGEIGLLNVVWIERLSPHLQRFLQGEEEEKLVALGTIYKFIPFYPYFTSRYLKIVAELLVKANKEISERCSLILLEFSKYIPVVLSALLPFLLYYVKQVHRQNDTVALNIAQTLNNLSYFADLKKELKDILNLPAIWEELTKRVLEYSMVFQHQFSIKEFLWLFNQELFIDVLSNLVLNIHNDRGSFLGIFRERNWQTVGGDLKFAHTGQRFTVAHPLNIYFAETLKQWQDKLLQDKINQPFLHIFRPIHSLNLEEITANSSKRFAGYKLNNNKARQLLQQEGFTLEGSYAIFNWYDVNFSFHIECFSKGKETMKIGEFFFYTLPSEDLANNSSSFNKVPLWQVDPIIFSESVRKIENIISICSIQ